MTTTALSTFSSYSINLLIETSKFFLVLTQKNEPASLHSFENPRLVAKPAIFFDFWF